MKNYKRKYRSELDDNFLEDLLRVFSNGINP